MADNKSCEGKVIGGKRMCGKTTRLIERANKENLYILCANKNMASIIYQQSQDMKLNIPYPVTVSELPLKGYMKEILVDEAEMVLSQLAGKRVVGMSTSMELTELDKIDKSKPPVTAVKKKSIGSLTLDIDCSDALTGLKSVQREAKKATAALKELDDQMSKRRYHG